MLDPATQNAIGRQLRLMYDGLGRPLPIDRGPERGRARPVGPDHARDQSGRTRREPQSLDSARLPR